MRHDTRYEKLDTLDDYELVNESQDIRGRPLVNERGEKFGVISDLLVGADKDRVAAVRLEDGRCCSIEPLEIHDNVVVYGSAAVAHAETGGTAISSEVIPIVEERVTIGKRTEDHGKSIGVRTRVVSDTVTDNVVLRDETVTVDTRNVGRKISGQEADALLEGKTVTMTEHDEKLVVAKDAVVTDEVVLKKTGEDRVEHVEETVRRTEVDVDKTKARDRS
jgi:stress response protein YsnF